jgi:hypothetical protein
MESYGECPGWIFKHKAKCNAPNTLVVSEGMICTSVDGEEQHSANEACYCLDLNSMKWKRQ